MFSRINASVKKTIDHFFIQSVANSRILTPSEEKQSTLKVMEVVKPFFLSPYKDWGFWKKATRQINGKEYVVHRFNHGLAHGLRQGALSKDILEVLLRMKTKYGTLDHPELDEMAHWVCTQSQSATGKNFFKKVELAASFQRSGRQSEGSSSHDIEKYKRYEKQDAINFRNAACKSNLFKDQLEITIFEEAILWANKGNLSEDLYPDLKYLRRILHAAHTFDLRRMPSFEAERIRNDGIKQLLGISGPCKETPHCLLVQNTMWNRIGCYLKATGDRDLTYQSGLDNKFFFQTADPIKMVDAICQVRESRITI